jgi:hypothetical protein
VRSVLGPGWNWTEGVLSFRWTWEAAGAQTRKVAPPATRFAPSGVFPSMWSWVIVGILLVKTGGNNDWG